ncbi:HAD-IB family hydrolase [Pseudoalteromonas xiamenensis]
MDLALFDFDGTITDTEMYTPFVKHTTSLSRRVMTCPILIPALVLYKLKLLPARKMRPLVSFLAFVGKRRNKIENDGQYFVKSVISKHLREIALERIKWHQARGDRVVVVSASLDAYLTPWSRTLGVELLCSELSGANRLSGLYRHGDVSCETKALLVQGLCDLSAYHSIYAYGDTDEDSALLTLATHQYLNWELVNESFSKE